MSGLKKIERNNIFDKITELLKESRQSVVQAVNTTMVLTYFQIGKMIVEEEQAGKERAGYGVQLIKELSNRLITEFGKGFSVTNIQQMRYFYQTYQKQQTVSAEFKLSWSHYLKLMRHSRGDAFAFFEQIMQEFKNIEQTFDKIDDIVHRDVG